MQGFLHVESRSSYITCRVYGLYVVDFMPSKILKYIRVVIRSISTCRFLDLTLHAPVRHGKEPPIPFYPLSVVEGVEGRVTVGGRPEGLSVVGPGMVIGVMSACQSRCGGSAEATQLVPVQYYRYQSGSICSKIDH